MSVPQRKVTPERSRVQDAYSLDGLADDVRLEAASNDLDLG